MFETLQDGSSLNNWQQDTISLLSVSNDKKTFKADSRTISSLCSKHCFIKSFPNFRLSEFIAVKRPHKIRTESLFENLRNKESIPAGGKTFLGEGLRPAFEMAIVATKIIKKAFKKNDFSENVLNDFEKKWNEKFGKKYIWSIIIRHIWACEFSNEDIEEVVTNLKNLPKEEFYKFIRCDINFDIFKKIIDTKIAKDIILHFILHQINTMGPKMI